jgi:hypothetical protein
MNPRTARGWVILAVLCFARSMLAADLPIRPILPPYAVDDYGPLPFPEEVTSFIQHEVRYLLRRQNEDGSWNSAQSMGYGKTSKEAGGTVDKITLTAMCGFSLRNYPEYLPSAAGERLDRARSYVSQAVKAGTLKVNVQDAPWRYVYTLRFLTDEYARSNDADVKAEILDTCTFILRALQRMQFRERGLPLKHLDEDRLPKDTIWMARKPDAVGGWGYLTSVKGSSTFLTSDALRELLTAKKKMPELKIPDTLISGPFTMLSKLRQVQPNSEVASYRYDAAGSFWGEKDIRADIGRLAAAELACLMYSEQATPPEAFRRTHMQMENALQAWLDHRYILDRVKFPGGHGPLSIAPWFWVYSYRTTLEAADYLESNDALKAEVQKTALRAIFKHMIYRHEPKLGEKGWIIGGDLSKELHDTCQLLDGLATMKPIFGPRMVFASPELSDAAEAFHATRYGAAFEKLKTIPIQNQQARSEAKRMLNVIDTRLTSRIQEIQAIHKQYPYDGLECIQAMRAHFEGHPSLAQVDAISARWRATLPERPPWHVLGAYPVEKPEGLSDLEAWGKIFSPAPIHAGTFDTLDLAKDAVKGSWHLAGGQLISAYAASARIQLPMTSKDSYHFETSFTRLDGDCMALMFPVRDTSGLLVVGGWGGKVSGLAYINGKDADRNATTRDGALSNGVRHTLHLAVTLQGEKDVTIGVELDGKPYLSWEGPTAALIPDRAWRLDDPASIGLGGYNAHLVFHYARFVE